jgi:hypothetical protein
MRAKEQLMPAEDAVVTKAVQRAASVLGLSQRELGEILGISEAKVSRLGRETLLDPKKKEFELAILLLRMFRSLDALVGGNEEKSRLWLKAHNVYLGDVPKALIREIPGLTHVVEYLDAMRGPL